jgi:hypothetical protein
VLFLCSLQAGAEQKNQGASLYLMQRLARKKPGGDSSKSETTSKPLDIGHVYCEEFTVSSTVVVVKLHAGDSVWAESDELDTFVYSHQTGLAGVLLHPMPVSNDAVSVAQK